MATRRVKLALVSERKEIRATAESHHILHFNNIDEALRFGVDAIVIATPPPSHIPLALLALSRDKHVLIEKPLSNSLVQVKQLTEALKASAANASVAYVLHFSPLLKAVREFLAGFPLGPILQVNMVAGQDFPSARPKTAAPYHSTYYRDRSTGGGAIQDDLTHYVNWIESIIGPTDTVICDCAHLAVPKVEVEDTVHVMARNSGTLVSYSLNQFQAPGESMIQFNGIDGSLRLELHANRYGVFRRNQNTWNWTQLPKPVPLSDFLLQAHAFIDQIEGRPHPLCSIETAVATLRFGLAAIASADAGGRPVHLSDFRV